MNFTKENIQEVMNSYPDLSPHGFLAEKERFQNKNDRASMGSEHFKAEVNNAADYIESYPGTMSKNGSYGLKHKAEKWRSTYISNGAFIVAAILLGYRPKRYPDSPNCTFSKKHRRPLRHT